MIYIFTALHCEASLFIRHYHLTKNPKNTRFQEFHNESAGIRLTVTGVGEIAAAAAVGSVCTENRPTQGDVLLNIGTCARKAGSDGIFLCNKITEQTTGKTFYPDILYRHDLTEETIVTGMIPCYGDDNKMSAAFSDRALYDMEAAAIYQSGSYFFGPHQMMFLKIVSDSGKAKAVSKEQVAFLMEAYREQLCGFIGLLQKITAEYAQMENCPIWEQGRMVEKLCADLRCSKVMSDSLRQHIRYFALTGTDTEAVIRGMYEEGLLPCKDKREGKLRFEELKRRLF